MWQWEQAEPFGVNVPDQNPSGLGTFEFNLRYPGQYFDKETNLHYNYFRDYDPSIGRYGESDPVGLEGGLNTYAYVAGNPLGMTDPQGLQGVSNLITGYNVFLCVRALPAIKKYAKECEEECPPPDDLKGQIQFIEKYTASGQLDAAMIGCTCEKAGPRICGDAIAKCTGAVRGKVRPRTQ